MIEPREGMDLRELLLEEDRDADPVRFWGRTALYAFLFLWGWRFILSSVARTTSPNPSCTWSTCRSMRRGT
jgi:hypothetical protein